MANAIIGKSGVAMARQTVLAEIEIANGRLTISFPFEVRPEIVLQIPQFTRREKEVLELMQQGYIAKEIAARCGMRPRTVKYHMSNLYRKFRVSDRAELLATVGTKPKT